MVTRARRGSLDSPCARSLSRRRRGAQLLGWLLGVALSLPALRAAIAEPSLTVDEAYQRLGIRRAAVPTSDPALGPEDAQSLETLFRLTDEAVALNVSAGSWLRSRGREGLHADAYRERSAEVQARLAALRTPDRLRAPRQLIGEALRLQQEFVAEWAKALASGRPFDSQLTSEYGYHEGLHRSHRKLLQAFGELRALFPDASEETRRIFRDRLRALDFL